MSRGSLALLTGLAMTLLCATESYVTSMEAHYQAQLKRVAQPTRILDTAPPDGRPDAGIATMAPATESNWPKCGESACRGQDANQPPLAEASDDP